MRRCVKGIDYELSFKKIKNGNLRIHAGGEVFVSVPYGVSAEEVDRFVLSRAEWIQEKIRRCSEAEQSPACRFEEGGYLLLSGKRQTIRVIKGAEAKVLQGEDGLTVFLREEGELRPLLRRFLEEAAATRFKERLDILYPLVKGEGIPRPILKTRWMLSRWGSCAHTKGKITLNYALIALPEESLDYVILHELVHFLQPDHSLGFYREMDERMPNHRERRTEINRYSLKELIP